MTVALCLLGIGAVLGVWASEMPRSFAWPLSVLAAGYGAWLARRESNLPHRQLVWPIDGNPSIDGSVLQAAELHWRGPLAFLRWRDAGGLTQRLAWWPDTLDAQARRELRLAATGSTGTRPVTSMAP